MSGKLCVMLSNTFEIRKLPMDTRTHKSPPYMICHQAIILKKICGFNFSMLYFNSDILGNTHAKRMDRI